jgi:hypothetical protein
MGEVRMPNISMSEDARDVMKKLRDAGFINIVDQPKHDSSLVTITRSTRSLRSPSMAPHLSGPVNGIHSIRRLSYLTTLMFLSDVEGKIYPRG